MHPSQQELHIMSGWAGGKCYWDLPTQHVRNGKPVLACCCLAWELGQKQISVSETKGPSSRPVQSALSGGAGKRGMQVLFPTPILGLAGAAWLPLVLAFRTAGDGNWEGGDRRARGIIMVVPFRPKHGDSGNLWMVIFSNDHWASIISWAAVVQGWLLLPCCLQSVVCNRCYCSLQVRVLKVAGPKVPESHRRQPDHQSIQGMSVLKMHARCRPDYVSRSNPTEYY